MRYFVTLAGRTVTIDLTGPDPVVDGRVMRAEMTRIPGTSLRHLLLDHAAHALLASRGEGEGVWRITVDGRTHEVEAIDERTRTLREMTGGHAVETDRRVLAPMPGLVVRLEVEVGDTVRAGQGVAVVEAMKMENELAAPTDGRVASIEVVPGQVVEKGAVLMVLQ